MDVPSQWKTRGLKAQHASSRLRLTVLNITLVQTQWSLAVENCAAPSRKKSRLILDGHGALVSYHIARAM